MDTDIRDEIDRSFDEGPPIDDLDLLLDRGHAAVRRRRLTEGASLLLVAGVVAVLALVSTGGNTGSTSPAPAVNPTAEATPESPPVVPDSVGDDVVALVEENPPVGAPAVWYDDGFVHVRTGVEIIRTIANPFDRADIAESAAVVYVQGGATYWFACAVQKDGMTYSTDVPAKDNVTFERWLANSYPVKQTDDGRWPGRTDVDLVEFAGGDTEQLVPSAGATIVEQRAHPALPDSFATGRDASAVALVELDGERWYVLARQSPGSPPQYIAVTEADGGATLDAFLAMSRERYAEGGGGLL